jgi:hypothetical protein
VPSPSDFVNERSQGKKGDTILRKEKVMKSIRIHKRGTGLVKSTEKQKGSRGNWKLV